MDILKLLQLQESKTLEFKRDTSNLTPIVKSIVAFANTAGGILLIGVNDDRSIFGLENPGKIQEQVANAINDCVKPQLSPDFLITEVSGKSILVVQVDYMPAPYYLVDKGEEKGVYIRLGNSNKLASKEAITEMKRAALHPFFDKASCDNVLESDLEKALIQKVLSKGGTSRTATKPRNSIFQPGFFERFL